MHQCCNADLLLMRGHTDVQSGHMTKLIDLRWFLEVQLLFLQR